MQSQWYLRYFRALATSSGSNEQSPGLDDHFCFKSLPEDAFDEFQAAKLWRLACALCKHRSMSMAQWRWLPPFQFIGLLANEEAKRKAALQMQEKSWTTLLECEKLQFTNPELQQVLVQVPWLRDDVC